MQQRCGYSLPNIAEYIRLESAEADKEEEEEDDL